MNTSPKEITSHDIGDESTSSLSVPVESPNPSPTPPAQRVLMEALIRACQAELGYEDGDLLTNIRRFKAYSQSEIDHAKSGHARLAAYCERLQARLDPSIVQEIVKTT